MTTTGWRNWARTVHATPARMLTPRSTADVSAAVRQAVDERLTLRAAGTGHSFTPLVATDGVLLRPEGLTGLLRIDDHTVTVAAGTMLHDLNLALAERGLALANMGDITVQTVAGAIATGTHGTGRASASLSAQVSGLELVLADGSVATCSRTQDRELFEAGRLGLGAVGVVTAVTLDVGPAFLLHAVEEPRRLDDVLETLDDVTATNDHAEFFWFPHTDRTLTKRNNRVGPEAVASPLSRLRTWRDDELLSNTVFGLVCRAGRTAPRLVPAINQVSGRALGRREYVDASFRVFASPRRVRFTEQEYAVPRAALRPLLAELRELVGRFQISFPVEVRVAPADDVWLSAAHGRDTAWVAVHMFERVPYADYFAAVEERALAVGGRPHWGKLHTRDAAWCAEELPGFARFRAVRDRVDPDRVFSNDHVRHVLGD
jgi:L-gulono-1,4-lactone dehydrogenase